jgi:hypothetical protein
MKAIQSSIVLEELLLKQRRRRRGPRLLFLENSFL